MLSVFQKKKVEKKKNIRYILTIDGGGMRGIVPAYILEKMDEVLKEKTSRPLYSLFDLIAGTSTGALIALGLTADIEGTILKRDDGEEYMVEKTYKRGKLLKREYRETVGYMERKADPECFLELYEKNGKNIFLRKETKGFKKLISNINRFFSDKYEAEPYENYLVQLYGDIPLSSASVPTMAVSYNLSNGKSFLFRSWDDEGWLVREAARASSAAPTYFPPARFINRKTDEQLTLADGGIIANNPILAAYIEARKLYPDAEEFRILSLSTASSTFHIDADELTSTFDWMSPLLKAYGSANMSISLEGVESIKGVSVVRVWEDVLKTHIALDDTSEEAMSTLKEAAEEIWKDKKKAIIAFMDEILASAHIPEKIRLTPAHSRNIEERTSPSLTLPSL